MHPPICTHTHTAHICIYTHTTHTGMPHSMHQHTCYAHPHINILHTPQRHTVHTCYTCHPLHASHIQCMHTYHTCIQSHAHHTPCTTYTHATSHTHIIHVHIKHTYTTHTHLCMNYSVSEAEFFSFLPDYSPRASPSPGSEHLGPRSPSLVSSPSSVTASLCILGVSGLAP